MMDRLEAYDLDNEDLEQYILPPKLVIFGVGGAGNNIVEPIYLRQLRGVETIALNTDAVHLNRCKAHRRLVLGAPLTHGRGAGGDPLLGRRAAEHDAEMLAGLVEGAHLVFIITGLGGGTGTGASPVLAKLARRAGARTIGVAVLPLEAESKQRRQAAQNGLREFERACDCVIPLDNEILNRLKPDYALSEAFDVMTDLIGGMIQSLTSVVNESSDINIDLADLHKVLGAGGQARLLYGESEASDPASVLDAVLSNPLMGGAYRNATAALVHVEAGPNFSMAQHDEVLKGIKYDLDENANIIWGLRTVFGDTPVRVVVLVAGIPSDEEIEMQVAEPMASVLDSIPMVQ